MFAARVIEYALNDDGRPGATGTTYRLVTTILDPADAPADELAASLRRTLGDRVDLRRTQDPPARPAGDPAFAHPRRRLPGGLGLPLRALRHTRTHPRRRDHGDLDPDRISFTRAMHAARRSVRTGLTGTVNLASALRHATIELLHGLLPKRRMRANARVVRRKMSNYNVKTRPTPRLAHPHPANRTGHPHHQTTLSYWYWANPASGRAGSDFHKQNRARAARFRAPELLQARCSRFWVAFSSGALENACGNL